MAPLSNAELTGQINGRPPEEENFLIMDDLIRARAADKNQIPLLCFPKSTGGITDYEEFGGRDIDRFVDHAAKYYMKCGLKPVCAL